MKHIICSFLLTFSLSLAVNSYAQAGHRGPMKEVTPKEIAEKKTRMLESELSLTEKQRKKVYKLYLKEAKAMQSKASSSTFRPMGPPPGGGPGGHGGGGMALPPNMGSFDNESGMSERPHGRGQSNIQESDEDMAKRKTKMKKILSAAQYDQWVKLEKQRKHKEFQEKLLRDAEKPLQK